MFSGFLLILDAKTMSLLAEVTAPQLTPLGLHNKYVLISFNSDKSWNIKHTISQSYRKSKVILRSGNYALYLQVLLRRRSTSRWSCSSHKRHLLSVIVVILNFSFVKYSSFKDTWPYKMKIFSICKENLY